MLGTTQEAVNSALKRARATVNNHLADSSSTGSRGTSSRRPARQPDTAAEHRLVARLTNALERADLDALIELLVTDVRFSMPPAMLDPRHRISPAPPRRRHLPPRPHLPLVTPATAEQPLPASCTCTPRCGRSMRLSFLVIAGDHITAITGFSTNVMTRFGLPEPSPKQIDRLLAPGAWLPPSRNSALATTQEWANSGSTSIQQLDTRRLHAARDRRLNVSFPVAAAGRSVAGADLAQRADGGAAPPPDQGAQGAGVLVADRRGDGVNCLVGRAEQEGRLIQPDLVEEVDR